MASPEATIEAVAVITRVTALLDVAEEVQGGAVQLPAAGLRVGVVVDGPISVLGVPAEVTGDIEGPAARVAEAIAVVPLRSVTEASVGVAQGGETDVRVRRTDHALGLPLNPAPDALAPGRVAGGDTVNIPA